jgi:hypothetical protein
MKNWKPLADRLRRFASQPDSALLIELASAAVFLALVAHLTAE